MAGLQLGWRAKTYAREVQAPWHGRKSVLWPTGFVTHLTVRLTPDRATADLAGSSAAPSVFGLQERVRKLNRESRGNL
jgi:hypothetical protein